MSLARGVCAWLLAGLVVCACGNEEVVLFELPAQPIQASGGVIGSGGNERGGSANGGTTGGTGTGGVTTGGSFGPGGRIGAASGGMPGGFGAPCSEDVDCPTTSFCQMPTCEAVTGICLPRPVFCVADRAEPNPVCGCNQVTYWNECERQRAGERSQSFGECGVDARSCRSADDCGNSAAFCSKLIGHPDRCEQSDTGTCWVLPEACPPGDSMRWLVCLEEPPYPGEPLPDCVDTCSAIRSERPHFSADRRRFGCDEMWPQP